MLGMKFSCTEATTDLNHISNYEANGVGAICSRIISTLHFIHEVEKLNKYKGLIKKAFDR